MSFFRCSGCLTEFTHNAALGKRLSDQPLLFLRSRHAVFDTRASRKQQNKVRITGELACTSQGICVSCLGEFARNRVGRQGRVVRNKNNTVVE